MASDPQVAESPGALNDRVYVDYGLFRLEFREYPEIKGLGIEMIAVAPEDRGQGHARGAMEEIVKWADLTGTTLYLTPDALNDGTPGVSLPRLKRFYRSLDFVKRPSGHGDFQVQDSMMREPKGAAGVLEENPTPEPTPDQRRNTGTPVAPAFRIKLTGRQKIVVRHLTEFTGEHANIEDDHLVESRENVEALLAAVESIQHSAREMDSLGMGTVTLHAPWTQYETLYRKMTQALGRPVPESWRPSKRRKPRRNPATASSLVGKLKF